MPITTLSGHSDSQSHSIKFITREEGKLFLQPRAEGARSATHRGLTGSGRPASPEPLVFQLKERNIFGKEVNPLLELGMESLQTHLEDLSEGGSQYVGHLKFEMISISLLSKYEIEPIFHKCGFVRSESGFHRKIPDVNSFFLTVERRTVPSSKSTEQLFVRGLCGCFKAPAPQHDLGTMEFSGPHDWPQP